MSSNKKENAENRAVAYVRVSSQRQVDEGVSIAAQTRRIKDYAHFKGLSLADNDIFIDEGISGGVPLWQRPQGGAMHRRMLRENIPHLISLKIDRMFRMGFQWALSLPRDEHGPLKSLCNDSILFPYRSQMTKIISHIYSYLSSVQRHVIVVQIKECKTSFRFWSTLKSGKPPAEINAIL